MSGDSVISANPPAPLPKRREEDHPARGKPSAGHALLAATRPRGETPAAPMPSGRSVYLPTLPGPSDRQLLWQTALSAPDPAGAEGHVVKATPWEEKATVQLENSGEDIVEERLTNPSALEQLGNGICDVMENETVEKGIFLGTSVAREIFDQDVTYPWVSTWGKLRWATLLQCMGPVGIAWVEKTISLAFSGKRVPIIHSKETPVEGIVRHTDGIRNQTFSTPLTEGEFLALAMAQTAKSGVPKDPVITYYTQQSLNVFFDNTWGIKLNLNYGPGFVQPEYPYQETVFTQPIRLPSGEWAFPKASGSYYDNVIDLGAFWGQLFEGNVQLHGAYSTVKGFDFSELIRASQTFGGGQ